MTTSKLSFFIAGIMQGSHIGTQMHGQDYRSLIYDVLQNSFSNVSIYDPFADHKNSTDYDTEHGKEVFMNHNRMCGEVDVVIAYVPQASMGTAIEMWEAYRNGHVVITISPLSGNWAVKFLSNTLYPDLESFITAAKNGELAKIIEGALK